MKINNQGGLMNTKEALRLTKRITAKTGQACVVKQEVWSYENMAPSVKYALTYFVSRTECKIEEFASFGALADFAKITFNL
jgi:hypothetical protein